MIVAHLKDPVLRAALRLAAHAEEDVVVSPERVTSALEWGFPRLVVLTDDVDAESLPIGDRPVMVLDRATLTRWEEQRKSIELPPRRLDFLAERLRIALDGEGQRPSWIDKTLADLSRAAGGPLPPQLRGFGRRILEFPTHYVDLHAMADTCGVTRGALKARFRRRGLVSPSTYLRWFRMIAVANRIADRSVTISSAARRLGFTSDGNLCRAMVSLTGLTPTEVRTVRGWNRLLISFAWSYLAPEAMESWTELGDLFEIAA